jgi:uncharacterized Ntn-hydrolase superfamily protein
VTFSIVARDGEAYGVAVASRFLAVGAVVPGARLGVGAVATQSWARVAYVEELLGRLAAGQDPQAAIDEATATDPERDERQLGLVGPQGAATFTGTACLPWCGGVTGGGAPGRGTAGAGPAAYAIQGNILVGPEVVTRMEQAWLDSKGRPFARRLLGALAAGDAAGGDARGRQSAALYAVSPGAGYDASGVLADLRVDDHADPVAELLRMQDEWELVFGRPEDVQPLTGALADEVRARLARLGHTEADLATALSDWAGLANYESRLAPDGIDTRLLEALRAATPTAR